MSAVDVSEQVELVKDTKNVARGADELGKEGSDKTRLTLTELLSDVRELYAGAVCGSLPAVRIFAAVVQRELGRIQHRHEVVAEFLDDVKYDFEHTEDDPEVERIGAVAELDQAGTILEELRQALRLWFASEDVIARWGPLGEIPTFADACRGQTVERLAEAIGSFSVAQLAIFEAGAKRLAERVRERGELMRPSEAADDDDQRQENGGETADATGDADTDQADTEDEADDDADLDGGFGGTPLTLVLCGYDDAKIPGGQLCIDLMLSSDLTEELRAEVAALGARFGERAAADLRAWEQEEFPKAAGA